MVESASRECEVEDSNQMDDYLYDPDEVQRLIVEYAQADSRKGKERAKSSIIRATVEGLSLDDIPQETRFPTGEPLLAALVQLHRETDDDEILDLIETEMSTTEWGLVSVAVPVSEPEPDASIETLLDAHERFHLIDKSVGRYTRLRIFEALGAFDDEEMLQHREANGLTDEEDEYLDDIVSYRKN